MLEDRLMYSRDDLTQHILELEALIGEGAEEWIFTMLTRMERDE